MSLLVRVNSCNLFVEEVGPASGKTMLTLHSPAGGSDLRSLKSVFESFSTNYRVVFFDLRGSGRSEEVGSPSFDQLASDIEELRRQLGLGKVILTGGSGGGFLAMEYAIRNPQGISALILRGTGPKLAELENIRLYARNSGLKIDWERFDRYWTGRCFDDDDMELAIEEISGLYTGRNNSNPLSNESRPQPTFWHFRTHNFAMQEQSKGWDISSQLKKISVPTLIVHGDKDWVVPIEHARILNREIKGSRLEIFAGCGHSPQLEEKDRFVNLVNEFLTGNGLS